MKYKIDTLKLNLILAEKSMIQKDLAEKSKLSENTIVKILNGGNCSAKSLYCISSALNLNPKELINETTNK